MNDSIPTKLKKATEPHINKISDLNTIIDQQKSDLLNEKQELAILKKDYDVLLKNSTQVKLSLKDANKRIAIKEQELANFK